ncbi:MAG: isoprenyl transferase [Halothiobacillaceae bacterium]|jgi:undecaprenyl diphosphate synthase|nr:isoprenyl transferase [Halothiobacillaceae bacterium]MDY0049315.1 isoprenyl transferase [Halothiobacillaceae bacterium]
MTQSSSACVPRHIAIVMDGNGRWARQRHLPRTLGHRRGARAVRNVVRACLDTGVEALTLFAFSSENWQRPQDEVSALMGLFLAALRREVARLHDNGVQVRFIGERERLPREVRERMEEAERLTRSNRRLVLSVAISYGGRWDIVQAARQLAEQVRDGAIEPASIDESALSRHLTQADLPDPDLFIRTGGEQRISNFLLWQLAYAELYFTPVLWPEFDRAAFDEALHWFSGRERRYGRVLDEDVRTTSC